MACQFLFGYTTPAALQYSDQVETYLMDSMFAKLGLCLAPPSSDAMVLGGPSQDEGIFDHYERGMALFASTNADWPVPLQNVSRTRSRVVGNSMDAVLLGAAGWPACMARETPARLYADAAEAGKHGDCYVFDLRVPANTAVSADGSCTTGGSNCGSQSGAPLYNFAVVGGDLYVPETRRHARRERARRNGEYWSRRVAGPLQRGQQNFRHVPRARWLPPGAGEPRLGLSRSFGASNPSRRSVDVAESTNPEVFGPYPNKLRAFGAVLLGESSETLPLAVTPEIFAPKARSFGLRPPGRRRTGSGRDPDGAGSAAPGRLTWLGSPNPRAGRSVHPMNFAPLARCCRFGGGNFPC